MKNYPAAFISQPQVFREARRLLDGLGETVEAYRPFQGANTITIFVTRDTGRKDGRGMALINDNAYKTGNEVYAVHPDMLGVLIGDIIRQAKPICNSLSEKLGIPDQYVIGLAGLEQTPTIQHFDQYAQYLRMRVEQVVGGHIQTMQ